MLDGLLLALVGDEEVDKLRNVQGVEEEVVVVDMEIGLNGDGREGDKGHVGC